VFLTYRWNRVIHRQIKISLTPQSGTKPIIYPQIIDIYPQLITFSVNNQKERIRLKYIKPFKFRVKKNGGVKESRTPDLRIANESFLAVFKRFQGFLIGV
jgi:hypothetical protein